MATSIAPPNFSTSTSSSLFRASQNGLPPMLPSPLSYSDNPLTQLPRVDFNFEDLRQRMTAFTAKFDAFIEKGRKRVLEERNEFRGRLGELSEDRRSTSTRITALSSALSSHAQLVVRESAEKAEMQSAIAALTTAQQDKAAACARLRTAIATTQRQIDAKRAAQQSYAAKMEAQSRLNGPELAFWEEYLGTRIEGSGREDVVRVVFVFEPGKSLSRGGGGGGGGGGGETGDDNLRSDNGSGEREGVFELLVPERGGYEVVFTRPRLEERKVASWVDRLNESRDIGVFLKGMRGLFAEVLK